MQRPPSPGNSISATLLTVFLVAVAALLVLPLQAQAQTTSNAVPDFSDTTLARSIPENTAADTNVGAVIPAATDTDAGDTLTYSMEGADATSFTFDAATRQIKTETGVTYDHEAKSIYSVTVKVDDGNGGTGTDTVAVTITVTDVAEPPVEPAPPTVTATSASTTSVDVTWTAPTNTGKPAIQHYDLQYRVGTSGSFTAGPQDQTGPSASIGSLTAGTSYDVQVRATNDEGDGPWSASGTGSTGGTTAALPVVTIAVAEDNLGNPLTPVTEGAAAVFTLTRTGATTTALEVSVTVSETGDVVAAADEGAQTVSFAIGDGTATLNVATVNDAVDEADSTVTAALGTGSDYDVGTPASASLTVSDNDVAAAPEMTVLGNGVEITHEDRTPSAVDHTNFGTVSVRNDEPTGGFVDRVYTINNDGDAELELVGTTEVLTDIFTGETELRPAAVTLVSDPMLGTPNRTVHFSVVGQPAATVAPGGTTTFTIRYQPRRRTVDSIWVSIANNDADEAPYTFRVAGVATSPLMVVSGDGVRIDGSAAPSAANGTDFGPVAVAGGQVDRVFTVSNLLEGGTGETLVLGDTAVSLSGTGAAAFTVETQPATTVAKAGSTMFTVRFAPATAGVHAATVEITNNDLNFGPVFRFAVQGERLALPEVTIAAGDPVTEGTAAVFTLTRTGATTAAFTVNVTVSVSEAGTVPSPTVGPEPMVAEADTGAKTVTFAANSATATYSIPTAGDAYDADDSLVTVTLDAGTGYDVGTPASATVTVSDDDEPAVLTASVTTTTATVAEGEEAVFTVRLVSSQLPHQRAEYRVLTYGARDGIEAAGTPATAIADFVPQVPKLVVVRGTDPDDLTYPFDPGEFVEQQNGEFVYETQVRVATVEDDVAEADEVFELGFRGLRGVYLFEQASAQITIAPARAAVTITDDDAAPVVTSAVAFDADENSADLITTLTATDDDTDLANLTWRLVAGADQSHFTLTTAGALSFTTAQDYEAPGDVGGDGVYEVTVEVTDGANPVTAALTVTLQDVADPPSTVTIAAGADVMEGAAATFTLTRTGENAAALEVSVTVSETGDVVAADDEGAQTVTFARNTATSTLSVATDDDTGEEDASVVTATLGPGTGLYVGTYAVGTPAGATVTVSDNDGPGVAPAPTISSVEFTSTPGSDDTYAIDDIVKATVTFSSNVDITGAPELALDFDGTSKPAGCLAATNTATATCTYIVVEGDVDADGIAIEADKLTGGTIRATGTTVDAVLTHAALPAQAGHTVDGVRPTLVTAETSADGTQVLLTFSEPLDETNTLPDSLWTVNVDGSAVTATVSILLNQSVGLTLATAVTSAQTVTVSYADPTTGNDATAVQDVVGNDAASFTDQPVTNNVPAAPPEVTIAAGEAVTEGAAAVFTLTRTGATTAAFTVNVTVSETGDVVAAADEGAQTVTFARNTATSTLSVATDDDTVNEADSTVTAALGTGPDYDVGTPGSASVTVSDNDEPPPVVSTDATLSALTLSDGTLDPAFLPAVPIYGATVGPRVAQITVTLTPAAGAMVVYTDGNNMPLPDADDTTAGLQVALDPGPNTITITVTAEDGVTTKTYTVTVTREAATAPGAPTGLTTGTVTTNSIPLSWTGPADDGGADLAHYRIEWSADGSTNWTLAGTTADGATTTFTHTGLTAGTTYHYRVRAHNGLDGAWSATVSTATTAAVPTLPEVTIAAGEAVMEGAAAVFTLTRTGATTAAFTVNVTVSETGDVVAAADEGAQTVTFARNTATSTLSVATDDDTVNEADSTVTAALGTGPDYDVGTPASASVTVSDNDEPPPVVSTDATLSALTLSDGTLDPAFLPAVPIYGATVGPRVAQITVTLTPAAGAMVVYTDGNNMPLPDADDTTAGLQVALDPGPNTITITVTAEDGVTTKTYTVTVTREAATAPGAPTGLTTGTVTTNSIPLSWTGPADDGGADLAHYRIEWSADGSTNWTLAGTTADGATTTFTHTGLTAGTTYHYRVRAHNGLDGAWSATVSTATTAAVPTLPEVTIAAGEAVMEGAAAVFTLTRTGATTAAFTVNVTVSETGDVVAAADEGAQTVTFARNTATSTLSVATDDDTVNEADSTVTAALGTGPDYDVGTPASASVTVSDNDEPPPVVSTDATLSALTLSDGTLDPAFLPAVPIYGATVGPRVAQITVTATPAAGATIAYTDADDVALPDADATTAGLQVVLDEGANTIKVTVTAEDGTTMQTYTVIVTREAAPAPTISSVAVTSTPGRDNTYAIGDTVTATVTFSAAVDIAGAPQLALDFGGVAKPAGCLTDRMNTATTTCTYIVVADDVDTDGIAIQANKLTGGTIRATGTTVDAVLTHAALAAQAGHKVDGIRPTLVSAETSTDGTQVVLTFSENLRTHGSRNITVTINNTAVTLTLEGSTSLTDNEVTITLPEADAVAAGDIVTVALGESAVTDLANNWNAPLAATVVTNTVVAADTTAPMLLSATTTALALGLTYNENLDADSAPSPSAFTVTVDGAPRGVIGVAFNETKVHLTLASAVRAGETVRVSYAVPAMNPLRDEAGNRAVAFSDQPVTNIVPATATAPDAPTGLTATPGDESVTLRWTAPYDGGRAVTSHQYRQKTTGAFGDWQDIALSAAGGVNATSYPVTSLTNGTAYFFEVRAVNAEGGSAESNEASATPDAAAISPEVVRALSAGFGRMVGSQALRMVSAHLEGGGGTQVTVGGERLGGPAEAALARLEAASRDGDEGRTRTRTGREALLGSSFRLQSGGKEAGASAWGGMAAGRFETRSPGVATEGEVTTGMVGADVSSGRWLVGGALSHARGEGSFASSADRAEGEAETRLTAVHPYARVRLGERLSAWGLAGYGKGELTLTAAGGERVETGLRMRMGAVGARGTVVPAPAGGGFELALKTDALWMRVSSEAAEGLPGTRADARRVRLVLDASRVVETAGGATLTPRFEVGVRGDGGDTGNGTGLELGAGLRYARSAVTVEGRVRALALHEASGYEEWGASGSVRVEPSASGRGLSLTLAPTWGDASSAVERLWSLRDPGGLAANADIEPRARLDAELGYGLTGPRGVGVATPYAGLGLAGEGARAWRAGARWDLAPRFTLGLEATRREPSTDDPPEHRLMLRGALRW